eukprot:jgi/Galph1/1977/GphlegSOOS_G645.1
MMRYKRLWSLKLNDVDRQLASCRGRYVSTKILSEDKGQLRNNSFKPYLIGGTILVFVLPIDTDPSKYHSIESWYLAVAHYIIVEAGPCFLITQGNDKANARLVDPLEPEKSLDRIYFATNPNTRKIAEIEINPRVSLAFHLPSQISYVVVHGVARVIRDPRLKKHFWKPAWKFFYPQGPEGEDCVIVGVLIDQIEIVSHENGICPSWKAALLERTEKATWKVIQT